MMKNESPRNGKVNNGIFPNSFKSISTYLKIVSSGASSVASTVRSAASSIVEMDNETNHDQVYWAGFDKLELERGISRRVLLLGYSYGFQVWDVEFADNVRNLVSRHDGPVSFMQMLPKPIISKHIEDKFSESHPLLIICADGSFSGGDNVQEGSGIFSNGSQQNHGSSVNGSWVPTVIWFYSMKSQSYVHILRFRSVVHLVRCSPRVVAVLQSAQVHCFNTATLERECTIITNPVPAGCYGLGNIGFGPLAVGSRWMAYSGSQVAISNSGRVTPQYLTSLPTFNSNGSSLVAHYAKESGKQIAAGIVTLGDIGYKKLSRYYSELLPEEYINRQLGDAQKTFGDGHLLHGDDVGMVIVRDIVSKAVIAQFRAHKSPILSLCFDPSGILLVTASVQGHNINVFHIMPENSNSSSASGPSYVHIYRLQRGITNAVIQDISFSRDSKWIMISSSRGTSHLFAISPSGGVVSHQSADASFSTRNSGRTKHARSSNSGLKMLIQQSVCASGPTVTLSAVSRIRNGNSGRTGSLSPAIASSFHNCKGNNISMHTDISSKETSYYLLVFSLSGSLIQYGLHISPAFNSMTVLSGISTKCESDPDCDSRLVVEALQKWDICQKQNRFEVPNSIDLFVENGNSDSRKVYPEITEQTSSTFSNALGTTAARKEKITIEERNHMYISAAELQMHQNPYPLWARSEMSFQPMLTCSLEDGGEIEIEKITVRKLEARPVDLIPFFDYQGLKHQEERIPISSSGSLDSISNRGVDETEQDDIHLTTVTSEGCVNTHDTPPMNTRFENVNTKDNPVNGSLLRDVHNRNGLEMENQSSEGG